MKKIILWAGGILLTFYIFSKCNDSPNNINSSIDDTSSVTSSIDTGEVAPSSGWAYSEDEDKMTSKKTYYAGIEANETLQFDFPYNGGCTATLYVRKKGGKTDVFVQLSKAQLIIDSYDGSNFRVRFDNKPATTYTFTEASDHSSDVAFLQTTSRFIKNLKNSKKVTIEMEFYKEGYRAIEFNVDGFKWNH